jgi:hypothetical protein
VCDKLYSFSSVRIIDQVVAGYPDKKLIEILGNLNTRKVKRYSWVKRD